MSKMDNNRNLAEDLRNITAKLKTILDDPQRGPWTKPLSTLEDDVRKLNNHFIDIIDEAGRLKAVVSHVEENNPAAEKTMHNINSELHGHWNNVDRILGELNESIRRLSRKTEDLLKNEIDRGHPVSRASQAIKHANEEFSSRKNTL